MGPLPIDQAEANVAAADQAMVPGKVWKDKPVGVMKKRHKKQVSMFGHWRKENVFRPDRTYSKGRKERDIRQKTVLRIADNGKIIDVVTPKNGHMIIKFSPYVREALIN